MALALDDPALSDVANVKAGPGGSAGAFCAAAAENVKAGLHGKAGAAGKPGPPNVKGATAGAAAGGGAEKL